MRVIYDNRRTPATRRRHTRWMEQNFLHRSRRAQQVRGEKPHEQHRTDSRGSVEHEVFPCPPKPGLQQTAARERLCAARSPARITGQAETPSRDGTEGVRQLHRPVGRLHPSGPTICWAARRIRSRQAIAAFRGLSAYMIAAATATRQEAGSPVNEARTAASTSPPCRPIPGNRNGSLGNAARTAAASLGAVAPMTTPVFPSLSLRTAKSATAINSGSWPQRRCCRSARPGLDV